VVSPCMSLSVSLYKAELTINKTDLPRFFWVWIKSVYWVSLEFRNVENKRYATLKYTQILIIRCRKRNTNFLFGISFKSQKEDFFMKVIKLFSC
jgi:hypothetical protein